MHSLHSNEGRLLRTTFDLHEKLITSSFFFATKSGKETRITNHYNTIASELIYANNKTIKMKKKILNTLQKG